MEPIQAALKKWLKESKSFQESYTKMKSEILQAPEVKKFLEENNELTPVNIERQLIKLYEYEYQSKRCEKCESLEKCCNVVQGYVPKISAENQQITLTYDKCPRKARADEQKRKNSFVQSLYMPRELVEASFSQISLDDPERFEAIRKVERYLHDTEKGLSRGLYLYGPFGVGKTYLLGALANALAEKEIQSLFIYMPEFVREIKSSIADSSINQKVDRFKKVPILILDDIGSEHQSAWFRDEVLGAILQYRMMERLPVFFTSNYNLKELEIVLASSNKGESETLKARRIVERIKQVSEPVGVLGENRRM
ncbi:primosomal protein DnaI [Salirhabdus euzebyi]|uniref:Primosomal protein DnaI n=1 Tax=Salirhabdus euzebyi TaxID=394506 RepID=A0A841PTD9_9BACI|nr:primosomal protein DnaI [Salirhabdus euzebyi]MBB6452070.1 primosomal protein DnaI [Salirhabdus euzebyi]